MQIADIVFREDPFHPEMIVIGFKLNGRDAIAARIDQKSAWNKMGYVKVSPADVVYLEWENELQPITIPPDPDDNRGEVVLRGWIYSPELVALLDKMPKLKEQGKLEIGPVKIP